MSMLASGHLYRGVRVPVSPPVLLNPLANVVNWKLCTIRLANADTPAMPQTPKKNQNKYRSFCKTILLHYQNWILWPAPARRSMIPADRVIVALMLSSMFPIFKHLSEKMAISKPMAPRTIPTIIKARTAWSRAANQNYEI